MRRKTDGRKSTKTGIYNDISNQRRWNLLSSLRLLTCHPMAKSQAAILKTSWKATSVQIPVIVCLLFTPTTMWTWLCKVEPWEMYLQRQTTRSFLFIIPLWIVSVWEMASQVQQERLVSWNIRCTHRTQQRWRHCTTLCCVYSSTDF